MTKRPTTIISLAGAVILAGAAAAAAQQAAPRPATPRPSTGVRAHLDDDQSGPQAFSVVLVLGDSQTSTVQDNVPAAARKALADMKDFLPYKGYRLLDAQWTLCCGSYPMTSRLKGADEQEYELQLSTSNISNGRVNVRFYLTEAAAGYTEATPELARAGVATQLVQIERQMGALQNEIRRKQQAAASQDDIAKLQNEMEELRARAARIQVSDRKVAPRARQGVIDASFRMDVGETVVVGTSRTKGDKALIALLTAVPAKTGGR